MKKYLLLLFVSVTIGLSAQTVRFAYDECGNRTSRFLEQKSTDDFKSFMEESNTQQTLQKSIEVLPNPSSGPVEILLINYDDFKNCTLKLFSSNGAHLKTWQINKSQTKIDLSSYENGVYLLKINTRETQLIHKLIKY